MQKTAISLNGDIGSALGHARLRRKKRSLRLFALGHLKSYCRKSRLLVCLTGRKIALNLAAGWDSGQKIPRSASRNLRLHLRDHQTGIQGRPVRKVAETG